MSRCLYVVGAGQDPRRHMTLEGLDRIRHSAKVLILNGDAAVIRDVIGVDSRIEDIMHLYKDGALDDENYSRVVRYIADCCEQFDDVAVVVAGHPLVGVSWWNRLATLQEFSSSIIYVEGISSFTGMLCELGLDPLEAGTTIVDANRLLLFKHAVNPEFDLFVFNVASTGTRRVFLSEPSRDNAWHQLGEFLARFFPPTHSVFLVHAGSSGFGSGRRIEGTIETFGDLLPQVRFSSSLFVPAVAPHDCDPIFARRLLGV